MLCLLESSAQALQESTAAGFGEGSAKGDEIYHCDYRRPTQELSSLVIPPSLYYQLTNLESQKKKKKKPVSQFNDFTVAYTVRFLITTCL